MSKKRRNEKNIKEVLDEIRRQQKQRFEKEKKLDELELNEEISFDIQPIYIGEGENCIFIPYEMMVEIFGWLDYENLVLNISRVCQGWNLVSSISAIWEPIYKKTFKKAYFVKKMKYNVDISWKYSFLLMLEMKKRWELNKPTKSYYNISLDERKKPGSAAARVRMRGNLKKLPYHPKEDPEKMKRPTLPKFPLSFMKIIDDDCLVCSDHTSIYFFNFKVLTPTRTFNFQKIGIIGQVMDVFIEKNKEEELLLVKTARNFYIYNITNQKLEQTFNIQAVGGALNGNYYRDGIYYAIGNLNQIKIIDVKEKKQINNITISAGNFQTNVFDSSETYIATTVLGQHGFSLMCYLKDIPVCVQEINLQPNVIGRTIFGVEIDEKKNVIILYSQKRISTFSIKTGKCLSFVNVNFGIGGIWNIKKDGIIAVKSGGNEVALYDWIKQKMIVKVKHNGAGGSISSFDFDKMSLVFGTSMGGIVKRFYGPKEIYWSNMTGGKTLKQDDNNE